MNSTLGNPKRSKDNWNLGCWMFAASSKFFIPQGAKGFPINFSGKDHLRQIKKTKHNHKLHHIRLQYDKGLIHLQVTTLFFLQTIAPKLVNFNKQYSRLSVNKDRKYYGLFNQDISSHHSVVSKKSLDRLSNSLLQKVKTFLSMMEMKKLANRSIKPKEVLRFMACIANNRHHSSDVPNQLLTARPSESK